MRAFPADPASGFGRRTLLTAALFGAAVAVLPVQAFAHRQKKVITTVEWNANTNLLEITHILHLHDAEQALSRLGKLSQPDLTSLRARAQLALYAQDHFKLFDFNKNPIALTIVGAEIMSGHAYVYQEVALSEVPQELLVENTLLLDIYRDQTNLVNVTLGGELKSLVFMAGDRAKRISG
ncbi:MAG: hypothetical protein COA69_04330 [Robiginitomaculum sp.]|nr:MAG: hypothetical protein COA69_04330 [Robiginitomaculum sp.]